MEINIAVPAFITNFLNRKNTDPSDEYGGDDCDCVKGNCDCNTISDAIPANEVYQSVNEKLLKQSYKKLVNLCNDAFREDVFTSEFITGYNDIMQTMDNLCKDNPLLYKVRANLMNDPNAESNIIINTSYVLYYLNKLNVPFKRLKQVTGYSIFPYVNQETSFNRTLFNDDNVLSNIGTTHMCIEASSRSFYNTNDTLKCVCNVIETNFKNGCLTYFYVVNVVNNPTDDSEFKTVVRSSAVKIDQIYNGLS